MKTLAYLASICFLASACLAQSESVQTASQEERKEFPEDKYPFSEVSKIHETVVDAMTEDYFSESPEIDKEHTAKLKEFILSELPKRKFVEEVIRDENIAIFNRAMNDEAYRKTKEFEDAFGLTVNVAVPIAKMMVGGLRDVYVARFIEKNPLKMELFEMGQQEYFEYISWVYGEVKAAAYPEQVGDDYVIEEGDRFFGFMSPPETWKDKCGRGGFLRVRGNKILEAVITALN
jgi:hypothetical protein